MRYILLIIFFIPNLILAQSRINLLGGIDISGNGFSYSSHRKVLRSGDNDDGFFIYNFNGALQYRINDLWSFDLGLQNIEFIHQVLDTQYLTRHPENKNELLNLPSHGSDAPISKLGIDKYYRTYYLQATRYFPVNEFSYIYFSAGVTNNYMHKGTVGTGTNIYYNAKDNETLQLNYNMVNHYFGYLIEAGWNCQFLNKNATFFAGLRYQSGFQKVFVGNYTDVQNNTLINQDHIFTNGTYMGVVFKLGINLYSSDNINPKINMPHINLPHISIPTIKIPHKKVRPYKPLEDKKESHSIPKDIPNRNLKPGRTNLTINTIKKDSILPNKLENRVLILKDRIKVGNGEITVAVWDYDKIDGDSISLNLNGDWILKNYLLKEEPKFITVELKPGINHLILHAENLGLYEPCTSGIIINDGVNEYKLKLKSTLEASEVIEIFFEE